MLSMVCNLYVNLYNSIAPHNMVLMSSLRSSVGLGNLALGLHSKPKREYRHVA